MRRTSILDVVSRKLSPFVMLFGFYVVAYGHVSPGGGFQGGVVLASGYMLLLLCQDSTALGSVFTISRFVSLETAGFFAFVAIGCVAVLFGGPLLGVIGPVAGRGYPSAPYIFALNTVIGVEVGAGISLICFHLASRAE